MLTAGKDVDWVNIPLSVCSRGNCLDAFYTLKIFEVLYKKLEELDMVKLYDAILSPATPVFTEIELEGMLIDEEILNKLNKDISSEIFNFEERLYSFPQVNATANFKSTHDMIRILYSSEKDDMGNWKIDEDIGFGLYPPGKTDKGQPSTSEEDLTLLHEFVSLEVIKRKLNVKAE